MVEWHLKTIIVMVGLPARGKSYISKKIVTYQSWLGLKARFFNVGNHRREVMKGTAQTSDFFSAGNQEAKNARENIAMEVLEDLLTWLREGGDVAVFDATNTTNKRRAMILDACKAFSTQLNVIFVESICTDPAVIEANMKQKVAGSPDYKDMPLEEAMKDLTMRITNYEKVYESIDDDSMSYIKLINLQSKVICNKIFGSIAQSVATFLMSLNVSERCIWLCRSGQIEGGEDFNDIKIITKEEVNTPLPPKGRLQKQVSKSQMLMRAHTSDGFSIPSVTEKTMELSDKGREFAKALHEFVLDKAAGGNFEIYTSTMPRAQKTAQFFKERTQQWSALNMLDTGLLNGLSVFEIKKLYPEEFNAFLEDPFHFRIPGGESFEDLVRRVEPFIIELERQNHPSLVVSHLSTLRVIMAYFLGIPVASFSNIDIPQHTVIQLIPSQYGWEERRFFLGAP